MANDTDRSSLQQDSTPDQDSSRAPQTIQSTTPVIIAGNTETHSYSLPAASNPVVEEHDKSPLPSANTPISLVLQWLTYAFWGWLLIPLSFLVFSVVNATLNPGTDDFGTSLAIASVIVLLPLAFVCDLLYRKHEPSHKKGAAMVIMVIHAVIFILIAVGFLITAVITVVSAMTGESQSSDSVSATIVSSLAVALLYGVTVLRTFNPPKLPLVHRFFPIFMLVVVGVVAIAGFLGPIRNKVAFKNDTLIENNINDLNNAIQDYTYESKKLPSSLNELNLSDDARSLVDQNLVTYTPFEQPTTTSMSDGRDNANTSFDFNILGLLSYKYSLCATYTHPDSSERYNGSTNYSTSYIDTTGHKSGKVCYDLVAEAENN